MKKLYLHHQFATLKRQEISGTDRVNPNQAVVFCLSKGCGLVYWAESRHFGYVLRYLFNQVCFYKIFVKYHPRGHFTPAKTPAGHTGATSWIWQVPKFGYF